MCVNVFAMNRIGIYKTDVDDVALATLIITTIKNRFPGSVVSFDLEDCDNVLRIVYQNGVNPDTVREIVNSFGRKIEDLP
jgi:hypothetical protein